MSQQRARGRGAPPPGPGPGRARGTSTADRASSLSRTASRGDAFGPPVPLIYSKGLPVKLDPGAHAPDELIVRLRRAFSGPERPARPGYGTLGRVVALRANFFALESMPDTIYEYIVQITPEPKSQKPRVKRRVLALFEQLPILLPFVNDIAHDSAQRLVSSKPLPEPIRGSVVFFEEGDARPPQNADKYNVEVSFHKELSTDPLKRFLTGDIANIDKVDDVDPIISALNLVMQREAAQQGWRFGRNRYFFNEKHKARIGTRTWALLGFYSSIRPGNKLALVNVNICMSAFHEPGKLSDALRAFGLASFEAIPREFMRKVKVSTRYRGFKRMMTIQRIVGVSASRQTFTCQEFGGTTSIKDFFFKKYNITLQHADDLPVIDVGSPGKPRFIPAELCDIEPGEPHLGKLGAKETSEMLRVASRRPAENSAVIMENGLKRLGYDPSTSVLQSFRIRVASQMIAIPGRELPPPSVTYGKGVPRVQNGSWNILDVKFHLGGRMRNWKVLVVRDGVETLSFRGPTDERLINFIKAFRNKCKNSGMDVGPDPPTILATDQLPQVKDDMGRRRALESISRTIEAFGAAKDISFVLCLLQKKDDYIYPGIKRLCAVKFGIRSQCLLLEKALNEKKQDQYLSNVALKVNTKLGGINHRLGGDALGWLTKEPTILVGMDVTHPGPASVPGTPSIAGVVASVDRDFVQFPASLRLQKSKQEGIADLSEMIIERLQAFRRRSNILPKRMMVFRDGVSEGQYDKVIKEELPQIFEAFKRIDPKNPRYHPTLSIVICGKRHNARFYPTDSEFADRNGNTRPGTVVDKGVSSMLDFDFYLQAHSGLQGTVKPTHYVVIYDESSLTADMVQQGVHAASYLYARATKAVSLVPPAYYADIVCEQARFWIHGFLNQGPGSDAASSTDDGGGGLGAGAGTGTETGIGDSGTRSSASASTAMRKAREAAEQRVYEAAKRMWGKGLHANLQDVMFYL
ncbi:Piwi-domain-containing protein [Russula earlei]|uniref:Piwi-domain-containing protein n=1 Tax=Russula earlei TaxID=71964 RepID=A0ACC0U4W8_9AGAM|nr:Piwi-domain-containing protein [Russula earlei]